MRKAREFFVFVLAATFFTASVIIAVVSIYYAGFENAQKIAARNGCDASLVLPGLTDD